MGAAGPGREGLAALWAWPQEDSRAFRIGCAAKQDSVRRKGRLVSGSRGTAGSRKWVPELSACKFLCTRTGECSAEELERMMTIVANPRNYKIPEWFLNRQKDHKTGRFMQASCMSIL